MNPNALLHMEAAALWEDMEGLICQRGRRVDTVIMQGSLDRNGCILTVT